MVSDKYVEQLLQQMRVWMELRGLKPVILAVYVRCARRFVKHVGKRRDRRW